MWGHIGHVGLRWDPHELRYSRDHLGLLPDIRPRHPPHHPHQSTYSPTSPTSLAQPTLPPHRPHLSPNSPSPPPTSPISLTQPISAATSPPHPLHQPELGLVGRHLVRGSVRVSVGYPGWDSQGVAQVTYVANSEPGSVGVED